MATFPTSTKLKIDSTIMQCIPVLKGQSNYSIWKTHVQSMLQAYLVFEFIDGSLLYIAMTGVANQQKWKMLDCCVLRFIAGAISDSLTIHVNYDWEDQATCPSVFKALWEKFKSLFGTTRLAGQFNLFHKALCTWIHPCSANEDISNVVQLFEQMIQAGLNLPQSFRVMIILTLLLDDFFTLSSTITQTVEETNFTIDTITSCVLCEIDLCSSWKPLSSQIANVKFEEPTASANRTNVIWCSPPTNNQWRNQSNSHQRPLEQQNFNSAHQSSGNSYQKKCGPAKSNWPGKKQKKDWFEQCQNGKGKKKAQVHEVTFANTVIGEEETIDLSECFMDHIKDIDMENNPSVIAHAGWDEDIGMNVAGPSSMPFQSFSSRECPFWGDYHWTEEEEETEVFFFTWWYDFG